MISKKIIRMLTIQNKHSYLLMVNQLIKLYEKYDNEKSHYSQILSQFIHTNEKFINIINLINSIENNSPVASYTIHYKYALQLKNTLNNLKIELEKITNIIKKIETELTDISNKINECIIKQNKLDELLHKHCCIKLKEKEKNEQKDLSDFSISNYSIKKIQS